MAKSALVTGIAGQDGSYLAELLLEHGYTVHGLVRPGALDAPEQRLQRIRSIESRVVLHTGSLSSYAGIRSLIGELKPTECYHLAAQSFLSYSHEDAVPAFETNVDGTLHLLSAIKGVSPATRFCFAGSSEMFGAIRESPQSESTPFHPRTLYGISKVTGFELVRNFREAHGVFGGTAILFNHESPRRDARFVTRKITRAAARIRRGMEKTIALGSLESRRDWGFAGDYARAMHLMLQRDTPDDYVIASGETHSVEELVDLAFGHVGLNWRDHVTVDPTFHRPPEAHLLQGDASKANRALGWKPSMTFRDLVVMMVEADMADAAESGHRGS